MKKGDFVFVYGTLRRGERMDLAKQAHNFGATFKGKDQIVGNLYHLGSYPGVKLLTPQKIIHLQATGQLPLVTGELFLIREQALVSILDTYEGYCNDNPTSGLYDRQEIETEGGKVAWVYTYNGPVIEDQRIESGDWCKNQDIPISRRALRR